MTEAERKLWFHLRGFRALGFRFRRQAPFGDYVLDFYCAESKLAVELDGGEHFQQPGLDHDRRRSAFLEGQGVRVLRFTNIDALKNTRAVLENILLVLRNESSPRPSPFQGEGDERG